MLLPHHFVYGLRAKAGRKGRFFFFVLLLHELKNVHKIYFPLQKIITFPAKIKK